MYQVRVFKAPEYILVWSSFNFYSGPMYFKRYMFSKLFKCEPKMKNFVSKNNNGNNKNYESARDHPRKFTIRY